MVYQVFLQDSITIKVGGFTPLVPVNTLLPFNRSFIVVTKTLLLMEYSVWIAILVKNFLKYLVELSKLVDRDLFHSVKSELLIYYSSASREPGNFARYFLFFHFFIFSLFLHYITVYHKLIYLPLSYFIFQWNPEVNFRFKLLDVEGKMQYSKWHRVWKIYKFLWKFNSQFYSLSMSRAGKGGSVRKSEALELVKESLKPLKFSSFAGRILASPAKNQRVFHLNSHSSMQSGASKHCLVNLNTADKNSFVLNFHQTDDGDNGRFSKFSKSSFRYLIAWSTVF